MVHGIGPCRDYVQNGWALSDDSANGGGVTAQQ